MSVTVFLGLKGGVGTTGLAVRALRDARGPRVALDLDLAHGDLAARLGVAATTSIADLAALDPDDIEAGHVDAVRYRASSGVEVVPSPAAPELAEIVTAGHVHAVLDNLGVAGLVVVDAGSRIDVAVLAACRRAASVVLVARPDEICTRQVSIVCDLFRRAGVCAAVAVALPRTRHRAASSWAAGTGLGLASSRARLPHGSVRALLRASQVFDRREARALNA